jgi:hypothetical protein
MVDIATIFSQWQSIGVFEYLLPILLIFAVVFGILTTTNVLGHNKGLHAIIAIIIALMAVGYSSSLGYSLGNFLQTLFPRLGIGLAVLLAILILIGLFVPDDERRFWLWGLAAISIIIVIVILSKTFAQFNWYSSGNYGDYVGWIIGGVLILGLIIAVAASGGQKDPRKDPFTGAVNMNPWWVPGKPK